MFNDKIIRYITEEVWRQGHDISIEDGLMRIAWMIRAWVNALKWNGDITIKRIKDTGIILEKNYDLRDGAVYVGGKEKPNFLAVPALLNNLLLMQDKITPLEFYREFEEVHPFFDGNGRTGKILLNYLNHTLDNPIFPPDDFWGRSIRNP